MIGEYVTDSITFEEFEDRFVGATWGIGSRTTIVTALEGDVEHQIAHLTSGAINEDELKSHLWEHLRRMTVNLVIGVTAPQGPTLVPFGSAVSVPSEDLILTVAGVESADKRPAAEHA